MQKPPTINPQPPSKGTIDEKHTEMLNHFHTIETVTIPDLQTKKTQLKTQLKTLSKTQIDTYMDIKDQIKKLSQQIKTLKSLKKQYPLDNSKHIFDYFEQKKKVSSGNNGQNVNVLNSYFKIKAKNEEEFQLKSISGFYCKSFWNSLVFMKPYKQENYNVHGLFIEPI